MCRTGIGMGVWWHGSLPVLGGTGEDGLWPGGVAAPPGSAIIGCMASRVMVIGNRAKVSEAQHRRLTDVSRVCAELYNALLESWRGSYKWWLRVQHRGVPKPSASRFDLLKMLTGLRAERPDCASVPTRVLQGVVDRHVTTVQAFYDRCADPKAKPGFPRFKSWSRWRTIEIASAYPSMLTPPAAGGKWWRLTVNGLPRIRFADQGGRLAAAFAAGAALKRIRVVRRPGSGVEIQAVIQVEAPDPPEAPSNPIGLDLGIKTRVAVSDGRTVDGRVGDDKTVKLIKRLQRKLSRAKKGSKNRRKKADALARAHHKAAVSRSQEDHRLAHATLRWGKETYDGVAMDGIQAANLIRNTKLAKQIALQAWGSFKAAMRNQAAKAGSAYVEVNPAHTSRDCSRCDHRKPEMPLDVRVYECEACGLELDRDVNAAQNTCALGFDKGPRGRVRTRHEERAVPMRRAIQVSRRKTRPGSGRLDDAEHRTNSGCGKHTAQTG